MVMLAEIARDAGCGQLEVARARVAHVGATHHEDDHLGDVGGVIAEPLELLGDEHQAGGAPDVARVFHHQAQELIEELVIERIEEVVLFDDGLGLGRIAVDERVERLAQLLLAEQRELGQIVHRPQRRGLVQVERALGDVDREISDALEVDDDLQRGGDEAQIARGGLAQREQAAARFVDRDLEAVDLAIGGHHLVGELGVPLGERAHPERDLGLHLAAQIEQLVAQ
jgi:predicted Rdx family selenoprotein